MRDHWSQGRWRLSGIVCSAPSGCLQKRTLYTLLTQAGSSHNQVDVPFWRWDTSNYSARFVYQLINEGGCRLPHAKHIQKVQCPLKFKLFIHHLTKNAAFTWNNPQRKRWLGPNICILCKHGLEWVPNFHASQCSAISLGIFGLVCPYSSWIYRWMLLIFGHNAVSIEIVMFLDYRQWQPSIGMFEENVIIGYSRTRYILFINVHL